MQSQYNFTTFRSRTQTYDALQKIRDTSKQKQLQISKAKPLDVIDYKAKLENEKKKNNEQETINTQNQINNQSDTSTESESECSSKTSTNKYYCRQTYDNNKNYFF
jgi:hypothetical protein